MFPIRKAAWALALLGICAHAAAAPGSAKGSRDRFSHPYGRLPLRFEPNRGQSNPEVRFLARGADSVLLLTQQGPVLRLFPSQRHEQALLEAGPAAALSMKLAGANPDAPMEGEDRGPGVSHYLVGSHADGWVRDVPLFGKVRYHGIYPGIDLVFYGNPRQLEYDFEVSVGADPDAIRLRFEGLERLELEANGDLRLTTAAGALRQLRPVAYQPGPSGRREVEAAFRLVGDAEVQFSLGKFDPSLPLVIDPVLDYSAIVGPGYANAITVGPDGSAYLTGMGPPARFPAVRVIVPSEFQVLAFVVKLNPAGTEVLYSSFFDGVRPQSIALDPGGAPIVAGQTNGNFPLVHPLQTELHGSTDAFVAKLTPDGSSFIYATPLGGNSYEAANSVVSDAAGNAYVGGTTTSDDFPTVGALQTTLSIGGVFRTTNSGEQWSNAGHNLDGRLVSSLAVSPDSPERVFAVTDNGIFRTADGGLAWQLVAGLPNPPFPLASSYASVAIDPKNPLTLFVGGRQSTAAHFYKSTDGGDTWRATGQGLSEVFENIASLAIDPVSPSNMYAGTDGGVYRSQDGGETFSVTTLSRASMDWSQVAGINSISIAASSPNVVYVAAAFALFKSSDAGTTWNKLDAGEFDYGFQEIAADPSDAGIVYVSRYGGGPAILKSIDGGINWAPAITGLPDSSIITSVRLAIDPRTPSTVYAGLGSGGVFRSTDGAQTWQERGDGLADATVFSIAIAPSDPATIYIGNDVRIDDGFVSKISSDGSRLLYSTYLGGSADDIVGGLALDQQGNLYVAGATSSGDFPIRNALQPKRAAFSADAFLLKLSPDGSEVLFGTYLGGSAEELGASVAIDGEGLPVIAGSTSSADFPTLHPVQSALLGYNDVFVAKFTADGSSLVYSTYLGGSGYEGPTQVAADTEGRAYVVGVTQSADFPQSGDSFLACGSDLARDPGNVFLAALSPEGGLEQSLLIGGDGPDTGASVALGPSRSVYLTGSTNSKIFPTARQGFLGERGAGLDSDVFALQIDLSQASNSRTRLDCLTSAAGFRADPVAPGQIVSLFGQHFGNGDTVSFQPGPADEIPRELGGVRVLFNDVAAPLLFVSQRQINAIAPSDLAAGAHAVVEVEYDGERSNPVQWETAEASPAIFTLGDEANGARAAVLNEDGTVNSVANPAAPGSVIQIFATGAGRMTPALADDTITPLQPPWPRPDLAVEVTFFGERGEVLYAGAAPGLVPGVLQINVRLPVDLAPYDFYPLRLQIGDEANLADGTPRQPIIAVRP